MQSTTEGILSLVECPICFLTLQNPIVYSRCGHTICYDCYDKAECPICKTESDTATVCWTLKEIIEAITNEKQVLDNRSPVKELRLKEFVDPVFQQTIWTPTEEETWELETQQAIQDEITTQRIFRLLFDHDLPNDVSQHSIE